MCPQQEADGTYVTEKLNAKLLIHIYSTILEIYWTLDSRGMTWCPEESASCFGSRTRYEYSYIKNIINAYTFIEILWPQFPILNESS